MTRKRREEVEEAPEKTKKAKKSKKSKKSKKKPDKEESPTSETLETSEEPEESPTSEKSEESTASPASIYQIPEEMYDDRIEAVEEQMRGLGFSHDFFSKRLPNDESWRLCFSAEYQLIIVFQEMGQVMTLKDAPRYLKAGAVKILGGMLERAKRDCEKEEQEKAEESNS